MENMYNEVWADVGGLGSGARAIILHVQAAYT